MDSVLISIGPITIYWYSFFILLAFAVGTFVALKEAQRFGISKDEMFNLIFWAFVFGVIGARVYYVIFNWSTYSNNLLDVFKIWNGGLAIHGGIIAGLITIIIYCRKRNLNLIRIMDIGFVSLLIAQAIGRWGNFFNKEAHGAITTLEQLQSLFIPDFIIEGMYINGLYRQPTFFYESLWCLVGFLILFFVRRSKHIKLGQLSSLYLIWYGLGRFIIESMRMDSLMFMDFKVAQLVSIGMIVLGIVWFIFAMRKGRFENLYNEIGE